MAVRRVKFFNTQNREALSRLLDISPLLSITQIAEKLGVRDTTIRRELSKKGGRDKYNPYTTERVKPLERPKILCEDNTMLQRVDQLLERLEKHNSNNERFAISNETLAMIREWEDLKRPFSQQILCNYLNCSDTTIREILTQKKPVVNQTNNQKKEIDRLTDEIEALKTHIKIIYEILEKKWKCLNVKRNKKLRAI